MNNRIKTTWISLGFAGLLTAGKFLFYYLSGSVAVLSEAWHSFSDLATSLVILVSLYRAGALAARDRLVERKEDQGTGRLAGIHPELKISLVIGLVLLGVATAILFTLFTGAAKPVERPLITGIFFLVFSGGSYLLYKVQTGVGTEEGSAALHADGIHSRADMAISLLTASSLLIFYYLDINLDRYVGGITALIILVFALEILINSWICLKEGNDTYIRAYTSTRIAGSLLDHRFYSTVASGFFRRCFPDREEEFRRFRAGAAKLGKWCGVLVMTGLVLGYLSTCFYVVDTGQKGLKLRFGRIVAAPDLPGLHIKYPWPVETIVTVDTEKIRTLSVANRISDQKMLLWSREHGDNNAFISGDNNLFLPYAGVHYRIKDPAAFYMYPQNPEQIIRSVTLSLLTHAFSGSTLYALALDNRRHWMKEVTQNLQAALDDMGCGIEIVQLYVQDLHPPSTVSTAFEKVVAALQNKEKEVNKALAFKNEMLPASRGKAYKSVSKAEIYLDEKKQTALGKTENFKLRQEGFVANRSIVEKWLFQEAVRDAVKPAGSRTIIDPDAGISLKEIYNEKFLLRLDRK